MHKLWSFLWILCYSTYIVKFTNGACTISTNQDITNAQVLLLRPEGGDGNDAFFMPDEGDDIINVNEGQVLYLSCGGRNFRLDGVNVGVQSANASCTTENLFTVLGRNVQFSDISCSLYPIHTLRFTGNSCLSRHREFEIGYEVNDRFITLITGCFDESVQTTLYTLFELPPNIEGYQVGFPRPAWTEGDFYNLGGIELNTLYTRNTQRITINRLLGLEESSTKYVHGTNNYFLARGHLAAKSDFIFGTQQRATFYFANAAPQWQMVNQANWATMENNVQDYSINAGRRLLVYTGTYGVSTLPHEQTGEEIELYLYVDDNNNKAIPVPQLYWKAIYEPISRAGIVILGVNNPYYVDISKDVICPDVCSQINWLTWSDPTNIPRGYSYCCTVEDFRRSTGLLPDFEVSSVLA